MKSQTEEEKKNRTHNVNEHKYTNTHTRKKRGRESERKKRKIGRKKNMWKIWFVVDFIPSSLPSSMVIDGFSIWLNARNGELARAHTNKLTHEKREPELWMLTIFYSRKHTFSLSLSLPVPLSLCPSLYFCLVLGAFQYLTHFRSIQYVVLLFVCYWSCLS